MTAINFPAGAASGATHTEAGITWTFDGTVWDSKVADTFVNTTGDTMTGNLTVPSLNGGQLAGFRNVLINGGFDVWQRGDGNLSSVGSATWCGDRWFLTGDQGGTVGTATKGSFTNASKDSAPCAHFASITKTSSTTAGTYLAFVQRIEDHASLRNRQFTLSFYATGNVSVKVQFVMKEAAPAASTVVDVGTIAISGGWKRYTVTGTFPDYKADPTVGGYGELGFALPTSTAGFGLNITGVQLEPGPVATPFEHRPVGVELMLCQRYYETGEMYLQAANPRSSNGWTGVRRCFEIRKRATPTVVPNMLSGTQGALFSTSDQGFTLTGAANAQGELSWSYSASIEL